MNTTMGFGLGLVRGIASALQRNGAHGRTSVRRQRYGSGVKIFLSYRREDEPFGAALIDHALSIRFGPAAVFRASRSIQAGDDFHHALLGAVRRCSALLAIIGPRWLTATDSRGRPRLHDPADWVRREIAEAFRRQVRVIPVLLDANLPPAASLPADLAALARCQYHRVHYRNTQHDIDHLAEKLATLVPDLARPSRTVVTDLGVTRNSR